MSQGESAYNSDSEGSTASTIADPTEEQIAQSEEIKVEANKAFQEDHYVKALELYTKALDLNAKSHILFANRSFCHIKMENYGSAIIDAAEAIRLDSSYIKAYFRRGTAYLALGKLTHAKADFREAVKINPKQKEARDKLAECEKALRKERQDAARPRDVMGSEAEKEMLAKTNSIQVEASYVGPHLVNGLVTAAFMEELIIHLKAEKKLHPKYAYQILYQVREVLRRESTVVEVEVEQGTLLTVCGDVHGQFYDLVNIFDINGRPSKDRPYLFNGDFVDRGSFGLETVLLLLGYKVLYPNHMHLNRGNHETVNMNKMYGFEGEVVHKYGREMMPLFTDIFQWLPLAHLIGRKVLVLHGGLFSRDDTTVDTIRQLDRHQEPPDEGPMTELLWSDPGRLMGRQPSKRGVGVAFGPDIAERFLNANRLSLLIRSHECKDEGYEIEHGGKTITVFSAPNYCDQMGNKGAFIHLAPDLEPKYTSFTAVPHPAVRPLQYAGLGGFNLFNLFK